MLSANTETPQKIHIEIIRTLEALEAYRDEWDLLAHPCPQRLPMLSWTWAATFFEHCLAPGDRWTCLMAVDDSHRLAGVLPLIIRPHRWFPWCRQLHTPVDLHTQSIDFLVAQGAEHEVITSILSALDQAVPNWFSLRLTRIPETSPTLSLLKRRLPGKRVTANFTGWGSINPIAGGIEDYQAALDKKYYRNLKRFLNKLQSLPAVKTIVFSGQEASAEQPFKDFLELEASGWKGQSGTAILKSPQLTAFYQKLTRRLASRGWLEWHFLEAQGKIIAGLMVVRCQRASVLLKIAYDEKYSEYAPGLVLRMKIIEHAFASGNTEEINYLSDMPAWEKWQMRQRAHYQISFFPGRPVPFAFGFLPEKIKQLLQRVPGLRSFVRRFKNRISYTPKNAS